MFRRSKFLDTGGRNERKKKTRETLFFLSLLISGAFRNLQSFFFFKFFIVDYFIYFLLESDFIYIFQKVHNGEKERWAEKSKDDDATAEDHLFSRLGPGGNKEN